MRVPSEKQYATLLMLAGGAAGLSWGKRHTEQYLRRGWVTAQWQAPYYQWVRITPDGLRALTAAVERYGLPELKGHVERRVCSDCNAEWRGVCRKCGGRSYHFEQKTAEEIVA